METQTPKPAAPRILIATDFSATAGVALDWAAELARQRGARLELVHAITLPPSMPEFTPATGPDFSLALQEAARARLDEVAASVKERVPDLDTLLAPGTPSRVILGRAEEVGAAAIVLGTRGLSGWRHILLGSTAERVVQRAQCPVLCVHPEDKGRHRPIQSILVPTDFSADAELAIAKAHELLAPLESGAKLTVVHAFSLPIEYTAYGPIPMSVNYLKDAGIEAERRLFEVETRLKREGLEVETVAREGDPAQVIADEAKQRGVDLIAMGTRGLTGLRHMFLGSIAERVVLQAPCPVLTVRRES